eukprot:Tbor_TRINITY_DN4100_c0_g1::TRINITY_DN4100_c0_g1_i3::g.26482::m.26482
MSYWFAASNVIHNMEEMRFSFPSSKAILIATALGIPVAVLLHETTSSWMSYASTIPGFSWIAAKWRKDGDGRVLRNAILFAWVVGLMYDSDPKETPLDYVSDRITSTNARRTLNKEIKNARKEAFGATHEVINEEAFDFAKSSQLRDAALRRRHAQESRMQ